MSALTSDTHRSHRQANEDDILVRLESISTHFPVGLNLLSGSRAHQVVRAVDGVDLAIRRGEVVGLVGESGSGKTTLGRTLLGLVPPTSGRVTFEGRDLSQMSGRELHRLRRRMQIVLQDPHASLSPRRRISYLLNEPYAVHDIPAAERYSVRELLEMVDLSLELARKYPHELSGGQARRVGIARALALHPDFLVADEPTSGLDVSAASSVLNLMLELGRRLSLTFLIITHNLNLVGYVADRIAVMYLGKLVEVGTTSEIFDAPSHPYTRALLESIAEPDPNRRREHKLLLPGEIPSPKNPPPGCHFHPRCAFVEERCHYDEPALEQIGQSHLVSCHFWRKVTSA